MFRKYKLNFFIIIITASSLFSLLFYFLAFSSAPDKQYYIFISIVLILILLFYLAKIFFELFYTLNEIINTSVNCIFIKNKKGKYVLVNKALLDLYGLEKNSEIIGRTDSELAQLNKISYNEATRCELEDSLVQNEQLTKYFPVNEFLKIDGTKNIYQVKKSPFNSAFVKKGVLGISIDITHRKKMEKELSEIRFKERKRIVTDIHDIIGYAFTNLNMVIEAAITYLKNPEELEKLLFLAKHHIQQSLLEARLALHFLKNIETDNINRGLESLKSLVSIFTRSTGVNVIIDTGECDTNILDKIINQDLYRVFQESLTNAFTHGKASSINIKFNITGNNVNIIIADNGNGCENIIFGIGLQGISDRISRMRGSIEINSREKGLELMIELPLLTEAQR